MNIQAVKSNMPFRGWLKTNEYRTKIANALDYNNVAKNKSDKILKTFDWIEKNSDNFSVIYRNDNEAFAIWLCNFSKGQPGGSCISVAKKEMKKPFIQYLEDFLEYTKNKIDKMNKNNF